MDVIYEKVSDLNILSVHETCTIWDSNLHPQSIYWWGEGDIFAFQGCISWTLTSKMGRMFFFGCSWCGHALKLCINKLKQKWRLTVGSLLFFIKLLLSLSLSHDDNCGQDKRIDALIWSIHTHSVHWFKHYLTQFYDDAFSFFVKFDLLFSFGNLNILIGFAMQWNHIYPNPNRP